MIRQANGRPKRDTEKQRRKGERERTRKKRIQDTQMVKKEDNKMIDQKEREGEKREKEQKRYMAIICLTLLEVTEEDNNKQGIKWQI